MASNRPTGEDFLVAIESALEANLLPEPGLEVLQRTRDAVLDAVVPLVAQLRHTPAAPTPAPSAPVDRAAVLREAANGLAALGPLDSLVSAPAAWTEAIETLRRMADQIAEDLLRRMADEAQQPKICELPHLTIAEEDACEQHRLGDEAQQPETQAVAHPPTVTWEIESPRRGTWASWGTTYDEHDWARQRFEDAIGHVPARQFRLVRATTVYAVEAEHTPAAVCQPDETRQADTAGEQPAP